MKNFIFDLYGTLVDICSDEVGVKFRKAFTKYYASIGGRGNFFAEYDERCAKVNSSPNLEYDVFVIFKEILSLEGRQTNDREVEEVAQIFRKLSRDYIRVYNGVFNLLIKLKEQKAKIYLLSNAQLCFTMQEIIDLKLKDLFDGIEISSVVGYKKPSHEFFNHILKKYNLNKDECIFIGNDIQADMVGAKGVGLKGAYILSNISPESDSVEKARKVADFATDDFKELTAYLISQVS